MAAPENPNSLQRVKVYRMSEDGKWDDRGTGHVSMDYLERSEELGLYVIDEDDKATLLVHRVSTDDIYRKQEDTIISWRDPERSTELALSFQETAGCAFVWDQISTMQRNLNFNTLNSETFHNVNSGLRELPLVDVDSQLTELPVVEISTLPQILKIVTESGFTDQRRFIELMLKNLDFFQNLMKVFDTCEGLNNVDGLHMMFRIVKGIISFNNYQILEKIVGDELIMKIIGCLEYNPDNPQSYQQHRNHLKKNVVFKKAIPIEDPLALSKIHQTYRIVYLKDVVLDKELDQATAANLESIITANKASVVKLLKDDSTFMEELFKRLRSPPTSVESTKNLVGFLHEFCSFSQSLHVAQQLSVIRELVDKGIFDIIAGLSQSSEENLVLTGAKIIHIFMTVDPDLLLSYIVRTEGTHIVRTEGTPLLGLLVKGMMGDFGDTMQPKFSDTLTTLLSSPLYSGAQRQKVMDTFCEKYLPELIDFITASCSERPGNTSERASRRGASDCMAEPEVLMNICELLRICVALNSFRTNFLVKNMTEKVLYLTRRKEKYVVAAAIRVLRTLLSTGDANVWLCVVKKNLLEPIIDYFVTDAKRDNLPSSAVLELFEHICKMNECLLIKYVVDTFWDRLAPFENLASIQALKKKNEKCLESMGPKSSTGLVGLGPNEHAWEKAESSHAEENSDEGKSASGSDTMKEEAKAQRPNVVAASGASASLGSGRLVDYEDDKDDDEEDKPSPQKQAEVPEEGRAKTRSPGREESEEEKSKRQKTNSPEEEGEAKETENPGSSSNSVDGEKESEEMMDLR